MLFDVTVHRIERRERVFRVDAENRNAAGDAAESEAADFDFGDAKTVDVEYFVEAIVPVRDSEGEQ